MCLGLFYATLGANESNFRLGRDLLEILTMKRVAQVDNLRYVASSRRDFRQTLVGNLLGIAAAKREAKK